MKRIASLCVLLFVCGGAWARGLAFSEEMHGYAYYQGQFRRADVYLRVTINDIDAWRTNPSYAALMSGTMYLEHLPAQSIGGTLQILAPAPNDAGRLLTYRLCGSSLQFTGIKHVREQAGVEVIDHMTTLRGVFQAAGQPAPSIDDLLHGAQWTSELHFEWWKPAVVWDFWVSFRTIATPWYQELQVRILFVKTVFGALARTLFPWLF